MKKGIRIILSALLVIGMMTACGGNANNAPAATTTAKATEAATTTAKATEAATTTAKATEAAATKAPVADGMNPNINMESHEPIVFERVRPTLVLSRPTHYVPVEETWFFTFCRERYNIDFDVKIIDGSVWNEQFNLMINTGDLPDLFSGYMRFNANQMVQYFSDQGLGYDMTELIDKYAPGIKRAFEEIPEMRAAVTTPDGKILSLPLHSEPMYDSYDRFWVRQDWMKNLGMDVVKDRPGTLDEFKDFLKAFRDGDPRGDGTKVIPWGIAWDGAINGQAARPTVLHAFGYNLGATQGNTDNVLNYNTDPPEFSYFPLSDHYYEYLTYMAELWKEGLMDPDSFTQDALSLQAKGGDNMVAVVKAGGQVHAGLTGDNAMLPESVGKEPSDIRWYDYIYVPMKPMNAPHRIGKDPVYPLRPAIIPGCYVITHNSKYADVLVRLANMAFEWPSAMYLCRGTYMDSDYDTLPDHRGAFMQDEKTKRIGRYWENVEKFPDTDGWTFFENQIAGWHFIIGYSYIRNFPEYMKNSYQGEKSWYSDQVFLSNDYEYVIGLSEAKGLDISQLEFGYKYGKPIVPMAMYLSPSSLERANELITPIDTYVKATEVKIITGDLPLSTYDEMMKTIKGMGAEEYKKIYSDAYEVYRSSLK